MSNYLHYELISWRKYCLRMKLVHAFKGCRKVLMVRSTQVKRDSLYKFLKYDIVLNFIML